VLPSAVALVPAAGLGTRLGAGPPKALRLLAGEPLLTHAVRALAAARLVEQVVVAAPPGDEAQVQALVPEALVVTGGDTRTASVAAALAAADPAYDVVLVHDAARPLVPPELVDAVAVTVLEGAAQAVVPALPVADTIKRVDGAGLVLETVERADLRAVQTPQGFRRAVLAEAHARAAGLPATDDAGLVERLGITVLTITGHDDAFKITRPADLDFAEALLAGRRARA
jgi:2-C-methyl-D-erythritol 4-phosphate cytidylyltransferase